MATAEEIMLTFFGKDEVSNVAKNIDKNVQSMGSRALTAGNDINSGLLQVSSGLDSMVSKVNGGKTAMDNIFGTSSKAETNSVLLKMMSSTSEAASKLNQHVDDVTNSSLVSMQSLIPAMNAFKTATGATDQQIYDATEAMAGFGAKVLAQTGSTELAETAMMDLSKGIKGACASLDQYGITVDALKSTGLWDGDENDIEGYMAAVQQLTGDTKELMETNEGLDKQLEKQFSSAGKKLGNEFLPGIKDAKRALIDLNKATDGGLFAGILGATAVVDTASTWGQTITNMANGVKSLQEGVGGLKSVWESVTSAVKGTEAAVEGVADATNTVSNVSDIAAGGAQVAGGVTESKASIGATGAEAGLSAFDALKKDNDKYREEAGTLLKDLEKNGELGNKVQNTSNKVYSKDLLKSPKGIKDQVSDGWDSSIINRIKNYSKSQEEISDALDTAIDGVDIVADKSKSMKKSGQAMEGLSEVAGMIPAGVGAEAAAGATEATVASAGLSGLGASISSMLAPLLTIAAVVAIMIPVVVALAAEALIFIRALAEVFKALNFDKLDLSGDIDGLKQIGVAIWELCKAMAAVVATSWLTMVYQGISAIMLFNDPIKVAVDELKKTATLVKGFADITIPENVPGNLQALSTSLGAVAKAMWSLESVGVSVLAGSVLTLNGYLGTLSQNLAIAKKELTESAKQINSMSELDTIDEGVASKLEAVTSSLANVGKAMGALSDVNWDINMGNIVNLGGAFGTITSHLEDAKDEIIKAAPVINQFSSLPDIDQSAGEKLKKVSDAIKNVADSLKNLNSLSSSMGGDNGALGTILKKLQLGASIRAAKSALTDAAKQLQGLNDLPDIPDGIKTKLSKIGSTTATVINTLKPLTSIQNMNVNSASIASKVAQARYAISNSAIHLASLSGISTIPDDIPTKLSKVGSTAATLINTLKPLTSIANSEVNAGAINTKVAQARYAISNAATHIASLAGISTIPENIGETLNRVSTSARQVATAATNLNTIPVVTATSANIMLAVTAIKTAIMQLNSLAGTTLNGGIGALLTSVTNALNQLKTTLYAMSSGFYSAGANIGLSIVNGVNTGLAPLSGITIARVASATNSAVGTGRSGGAKIGRAVTQGFKQNLKMAQAMKQEMSYVTQAVNNGISAAKTAARNGAQDVVAEFKRGIETGSPGAMAWATYDEMNYINDFIVSEGKNVVASAKRLGQNIVTGFGNPSLNVGLGNVPTNYNLEQLHGMRTLTSTAQWGKSIQNVELHIHEGAVQLDARNLTTRESKQIMINALEGLDAVTNINIKGIGA
ncbi:MAG: hypothetical protein PUH07_08050 [Methanobrevibacter smithii]|nr:hypothetical protein [Methanobrevibacter smithii]MDD7245039.1 hypothetical protein [Methanobrevibacter smithii]